MGGRWVESGPGAGDVEMDDGVIKPGQFCNMAVLHAVTGGENGVQCVTCGVRGVVDQLGEFEVVHIVEEGGGFSIVVVVEVKVEVPEEYVVVRVYGNGGDKICDEVAEA